MPIYEFRCPQGHEFDKLFRNISTAEREMPCPQCGELATQKISAGAGLIFKGSGFYITDYGKDGKKDQRAAKAGESSGGASGGAAGAGASEGASAAPKGESGGGAPAAPATPSSSAAPAPAATPKPSGGSSSGGAA